MRTSFSAADQGCTRFSRLVKPLDELLVAGSAHLLS
jgi:hypothetical protein